jgi:hypothetical protein
VGHYAILSELIKTGCFCQCLNCSAFLRFLYVFTIYFLGVIHNYPKTTISKPKLRLFQLSRGPQFPPTIAGDMVAQKRTMRESPHKFAKRCSIISSAVFSRVVPLNRRRSARSIAAAGRISSHFFLSGAMSNKNNNKITRTTRAQWPAAAALLTTKIVGQFCRAARERHIVNFLWPLVGRF